MKAAPSTEATARLAILYGVITREKHLAKLFNISIGVLLLQAKPVLLVPWMVCTLFFLIVDTVLYIVATGYYFVYKEYSLGTGNILGVIISVCK